MNELNDKDWGWWPFLALRPAKTVEMDSLLVARMAIYFGGLFGIPLLLVVVVLSDGIVLSSLVRYLAVMVVSFFLLYRFTFAVAWNRRAMRLRAEPSIGDGQ